MKTFQTYNLVQKKNSRLIRVAEYGQVPGVPPSSTGNRSLRYSLERMSACGNKRDYLKAAASTDLVHRESASLMSQYVVCEYLM